MAREETIPALQSSIYVHSLVPNELSKKIVQYIISQRQTPNSNVVPWTIKNKYYEASVYFTIQEEHYSNNNTPPATVLFVPYKSNPIQYKEILSKNEPPEIALVAGVCESLSNMEYNQVQETVSKISNEGIDASTEVTEENEYENEDWVMACIEHGYEYVDCSTLAGVARLREALQAYPWPEESQTEVSQQDSKVSKASNNTLNFADDEESNGFEDDFAPFVSGNNDKQTEYGTTSSPTNEEIEAFRERLFGGGQRSTSATSNNAGPSSSTNDGDFDFKDLSDVVNQLQALKEQATTISDIDERHKFAEKIALAFAAELEPGNNS